MNNDVNEVTQNIILKMLETNKIIIDYVESGPNKPSKQTEKYTEAICKAYKAVYKTVCNPTED